MTDQLNVFDMPDDDLHADDIFARGSATSKAAAVKVRKKKPSQRDLIHAKLVEAGPNGMTRKEIASALGYSENTVRPRVLELIADGRAFEAKDHVRDGCTTIKAIG